MTDICLLLEGTYPYVSGGVSKWVSDLLIRMPDTTFSILYLGPHRPSKKKLHYSIPDNVIDFLEIYLFDYTIEPSKNRKFRRKDLGIVKDFLMAMMRGDTSLFDDLMRVVGDENTSTVDLYNLVHSYDSWKMLEELYASEDSEQSLVDYFWTWRFIYLPFFSLLKTVPPRARVYHSVSTGYAGVVGAISKYLYNRPFILTEHGIYTRERKIEISQADWIYSDTEDEITITDEEDFFKEWWVRIFSFFSKLSYERADEITTIYEGNRKIQIEEGADINKTQVIPNGIDLEMFSSPRIKSTNNKFRIGFVGRVVPIKDVKTFIRASKIIHEELDNIEIFIIGPCDEDKEYYKECCLLSEMCSLDGVIKFTGKVDLSEYYPKLDIIVLTSISEGQPIVILEAGASGIPFVASDVGACSELLQGSSADDKLLGESGFITPVNNPAETAKAVIRILKDKNLYNKMSETAKKRVATYYQLDQLIANYQTMYADYMEEVRWQV